KHAKAIEIDRTAGAHDRFPPSGRVMPGGFADIAIRRNATLHDHRGRTRRAGPQVMYFDVNRSFSVTWNEADATASAQAGKRRTASRRARTVVDLRCSDSGGGGKTHGGSPNDSSIEHRVMREPETAVQSRDGRDCATHLSGGIQRLRRSWHRANPCGFAGCPGFQGPVPQPVSMSNGATLATAFAHVNGHIDGYMAI